MLLYSTLLCKKIARELAGHKKFMLTKLGGGGQNRSEIIEIFNLMLYLPVKMTSTVRLIKKKIHCERQLFYLRQLSGKIVKITKVRHNRLNIGRIALKRLGGDLINCNLLQSGGV